MDTPILKVTNLNVSLEPAQNKQRGSEAKRGLLKDISFEVFKDDVLYVLGPNGAGKSVLLNSLMGYPDYAVEGEIDFLVRQEFIWEVAKHNSQFVSKVTTLPSSAERLLNNHSAVVNITGFKPYERAWLGMYLVFQEPVGVAGLKTIDFLYNMYQLRFGQVSTQEFREILIPLLEKLELSFESLEKELHIDFSGGEKKRIEVLSLLLAKPALIMLDELDSGLDIDSEKLIFGAIKEYAVQHQVPVIIVSHNFRVVSLLPPTKAVVIKNGRLAAVGGKNIVEAVISQGYEGF